MTVPLDDQGAEIDSHGQPEAAAWQAPLVLPGDRGRRTVAGTLSDYLEFGRRVREYQVANPDLLVHTSFRGSRRLPGGGTIVVEWWPRGEERSRG